MHTVTRIEQFVLDPWKSTVNSNLLGRFFDGAMVLPGAEPWFSACFSIFVFLLFLFLFLFLSFSFFFSCLRFYVEQTTIYLIGSE
jgi:hypothetical protein